ncbi:MAG: hypothetical protein KF770_31790, partial [Anaerolineae bacterium]|nr:hypothetical protein [Anaerolineae bacterium]
DAGLWQILPVNSGLLTVQAYAKTMAEAQATPQLQMGLDPTGGTNPFGEAVIWSNPIPGPGEFIPITISASIPGDTVTLFLRATQNLPGATAVSIWDDVTVTAGAATMQNPSFEESFAPQGVVENIPAGWTAFYDDTYSQEIDSDAAARDTYRVYAAWSSDRGITWSEKQIITENTTLAAGTSGAFRPLVYPAISTRTDPDSTTFFYIYESGDPPAGTSFRRYGRPFVTRCQAGTTICTEAPGDPIFPRDLVRPTLNLDAVQDQASGGNVVLVWDSLQADYESKDIYMTILSLAE